MSTVGHSSNRNPQQALCDELLSHLARGDIRRAGPTAERLVERYPDYAPGRSAFSELWLRCGRPDLACDQAERAYRLSPDSPEIVAQYAKCLVFDGAYRQAEEMAETALALDPDDHTTLDTIGNVLSRAGRQEQALAVFRRALKAAPENTTTLYNLATSLRFFGRIDEAEALFDRTLEIDPDDFQALHSRSILRRQTASSNHVEELERRLASDPPWPASSHIGYALGKELDDIGRPREAFSAYRRGAEGMKGNLPDRMDAELAAVDAAIDALESDWYAQAADGLANEEAVFVIGLPRTGSTLIERVLAAHPDVFAAGELHNFQAEARRLLGASSTLQAYDALRREPGRLDPSALGRAYIESTRPATGQTARFVDKLPRNDLWAPLIRRALPRARFILTHRNPMDAGYAIYRTLFQSGYHFSYDLEQIGRFLVAQRKLADALEAALPDDVLLELPYETLVRRPDESVRRLVAHCGLDWRDDLLAFHEHGGAVTTASSHQVRQPFHTASIGRWRAVAEELEPLRRVLEAGGIDPES